MGLGGAGAAGLLGNLPQSYGILAGGAAIVACKVAGVAALRHGWRERQRERCRSHGDQARYRTLFETSADAVLILREGVIVDANPAAAALYGIAAESLVGMTPVELSPPEQDNGHPSLSESAQWIQLAHSGEQTNFAWRHRRGDGSSFASEVRLKEIRLPDETLAVATVRDLTAVERNIRELQSALARQEAIFASSSVGILTVRDGHLVTAVNQRCCEMLGFDADEFVGGTTDIVFPSRERFIAFAETNREALSRGDVVRGQLQLKHRDGRLLDVEFGGKAVATTSSAPDVVWVVDDVTEQKRRQRERRWLTAAMEQTADAVLVVDLGGTVVAVNPAFAAATGYGHDSMIGKSVEFLRRLLVEDDDVHEARASVVAGHAWAGQIACRVRSGSAIQVDATVTPIRDDGDVVGYVAVGRDVTEHLRMQRMLAQSERVTNVGNFAAGLAHELNNPLGAILQSLANLERRLFADLPANRLARAQCGVDLDALRAYAHERGIQEIIDGMRSSGQRAADIVADTLSFSRPDSGCPEFLELADLIDRAVKIANIPFDLQRRYDFRNVTIVRDYRPALPRILGIDSQLVQVFLNLLSNAAQALADDPATSHPTIILRTYVDGGHVCADIEDNGPGISETCLTHIFEPFFTTKPRGTGTGLGLAISHHIVTRSHRGRIDVASRVGEFTRFSIAFPIAKE